MLVLMLMSRWFSPVYKVLMLVLVLVSRWFSLVHKVLMLVLMLMSHWFSPVYKVLMLVLVLVSRWFSAYACVYDTSENHPVAPHLLSPAYKLRVSLNQHPHIIPFLECFLFIFLFLVSY